ncbi:MAG: alpha/beta hydrolase fold domain-containing protein [Pseudomonadota bacterium]
MNDLDWVNGDPVELRRAYAAERAELDATAPVDVTVTHEARAGLSGLHFEPPSPKAEPILYFHGGSWMLGSPNTHRALCAWLALLTSRRVISVSYPLAPEHPWPAQLHAAKSTLAAIMNHESQRLFVAGDSAGGAMALWAAQGEVERVAGIAAFYPAYGVTASPSIDAHGPGNPALNAAAIVAMYNRLGCDPAELQNAVPPKGAPTLIIAAKEDPLFDDSLMLAAALSAREVTLWEAVGEEHAFLHHGGASATVRAWLSRVGAWMDSLTQV